MNWLEVVSLDEEGNIISTMRSERLQVGKLNYSKVNIPRRV